MTLPEQSPGPESVPSPEPEPSGEAEQQAGEKLSLTKEGAEGAEAVEAPAAGTPVAGAGEAPAAGETPTAETPAAPAPTAVAAPPAPPVVPDPPLAPGAPGAPGGAPATGAWPGAWPPPAPPYGHPHPYAVPAPAKTSGMAVAALVTGVCGLLTSLTPLLGFVNIWWLIFAIPGLTAAGVLATLALSLGLIAWGHARRGRAGNGRMALTGSVLGGLAAVSVVTFVVIGLVNSYDYDKDVKDDDDRSWSAPARPEASPSPAKPEKKTLKFGETHRYADGVTISVSQPERYETHGQFTYGHKEGNIALRVEVTVVNGSDKQISLLSHMPDVKDAKGADVETIIDGYGATKPFTGTLLPGKQASTHYTYSVSPDGAKELQVEASAESGREDGLWVGVPAS
ncbi:hypothetical protein GCM10010218_03500 [Streptomyces mashuensis]|uniref:DUF4352 domain-containing protein n=1 Tax=Streptomyces mashuensis TaxID=33904 RepID=A0A919ATC3_9ACTN|nr:DUF4190 domain-containing protein [Streptomyces mashuensis]GHF26067.1 hypothetical protein GCM10010218_03500 [Streptomyces mashuensis]